MVSNDSRTKRLPQIIISQSLVGLLMVVIALGILFFAQGYRFNYKNFKIIKTGIVYLNTLPKGADVKINGRQSNKRTPFAQNFRPGWYDAEILKDGYHNWYSNFKVESELVTEFDSIVLIKANISAEELKDPAKIALLNSPEETFALTKDSLIYNDYEIWHDDRLITRFSSPIVKAIWYPDMKHVLYQQGEEIRIIEVTGTNDTLLIKLTNSEPSVFVANSKGNELYYTDNGQYKQAVIR